MHGISKNINFIKVCDGIYNIMSDDDTISTRRGELTRLQAVVGEQSLTLIFPKHFASELGIMKGDFLNCYVDAERIRLIVEKVKK